MTTFAITFSVKNEEKLLNYAIPYYLAAGCKKIYVYLDGTTDGSEAVARSYGDAVVVRKSVQTSDLSQVPDWIAGIAHRWDGHMNIRKRINTFHATLDAAESGIDWIACIDPDEIITPDLTSPLPKNHLVDFLGRQAPDTDALEMDNLEVVPTSETITNPFHECGLFLTRRPFCEQLGRISNAVTRRIGLAPRTVGLIESFWYDTFTPGPRLRTVINPVTGRRIPTRHFLAYCGVKTFIRTKAALVSNYNVHKWDDVGRKLNRKKVGTILHYDLYDYPSLKNKFAQRSQKSLVQAFNTRYEIAQLAQNADDETLRRFFLESIAMRDQPRIDRLVKSGSAIEYKRVSDFFDNHVEIRN